MIEASIVSEMISGGALSSLGLLALGMAFTSRQRLAILNRDKKCQAPFKHNCNWALGNSHRHVHHLIPQRYAKEVGIENPDFELNGISLCENSHVGEVKNKDAECIHPDIADAKRHYGNDHSSMKRVFDWREEQLRQKKIYWNDKWDRALHALAVRNTQRAIKNGWVFPPKNGKSK